MHRIFLVAIFLLSLTLRFWNLSAYPEAVDEDELAQGYNAFSLLKNGTDEYGNRFPLYFESAGDYKYPLYAYLTTIPVFIFGLNETTTRSTHALAGTLSIIAIYFLAYEILKDRRFALLSAFVLAISPTHIHFSRVAYNTILGALFATISILFFLRFLKKGKIRDGILAFIPFVLSIFSYQAYRIFLPTVFILLSVSLFAKILKENRLKIVVFTLFAILAVGLLFIDPKSRARSQDFSILVNVPKLVEQYTEDSLGGTPLLVTRAFHNKFVNTLLGIVARYFSYFDPKFLFVEAFPDTERHAIPDLGLLYLIEAPLFLLGFLSLNKFVKDENKIVPLVLLFASPLASALVVESRSTFRSIFLVYAFSLLIALGIFSLTKLKKYQVPILIILGLAYFGNFAYFAHQYIIHKTYHHPWYSDVGLKEMVMKVNRLSPRYKNVVMSNGHYIPYLFYNKVDPREFISKSEFAPKSLTKGVRVIRYDKIIFNMPYECPPAGKKEVLYVCFGYQVPKNAFLVDAIYFRDGQPTILLVEFKGTGELEKLPERVKYSKEEDPIFKNGLLPETYATFWPTQ